MSHKENLALMKKFPGSYGAYVEERGLEGIVAERFFLSSDGKLCATNSLDETTDVWIESKDSWEKLEE